jgi:LmbE family N-acetylglucosaminyl deacetylase
MRNQVRPVYLSPHLDDAALSCGGLIHQQVQAGARPLVITCFAGVPDYRVLSPFAAEQHRRWGEPAGPVALRRAEDAAALAHLGAAYEHWDYLDCIYRRDPASGEFLYASEEALWGAVARAESYLIAELAARHSKVLSSTQTQLYAPLAVGRHVDHQLVLRVALRLRRRGWLVRFYEDYPYAEDPQKLARARQRWPTPPEATVVRLSEQDLAAKTAAIRCYVSQLDVLFGGEAAVEERVRAYALAVGGGQSYAERYWSSSKQLAASR